MFKIFFSDFMKCILVGFSLESGRYRQNTIGGMFSARNFEGKMKRILIFVQYIYVRGREF